MSHCLGQSRFPLRQSTISSSYTYVWQTDNGRFNLDAASRGRVVGKGHLKIGVGGGGWFHRKTPQQQGKPTTVRNDQICDSKEIYVSAPRVTCG